MKAARLRVQLAGDGVGAQHMLGKGVELRRAVPEEEGQRHRRERVRVFVVGGVCENHCEYWRREADKIEKKSNVRRKFKVCEQLTAMISWILELVFTEAQLDPEKGRQERQAKGLIEQDNGLSGHVRRKRSSSASPGVECLVVKLSSKCRCCCRRCRGICESENKRRKDVENERNAEKIIGGENRTAGKKWNWPA